MPGGLSAQCPQWSRSMLSGRRHWMGMVTAPSTSSAFARQSQ